MQANDFQKENPFILTRYYAANTQHRSWRQDMYAFLRSYRATPHAATNQSPAELFYGKAVNIKIPTSPVKSKSKISRSKAKIMDKKRKRKMKTYADKRRNAKPSKLYVGNCVLVKQDKENKLTTPFDPRPYEVTNKKGNMVTAQR